MAASLKISELNALTAMADDDLFLVTDTSATTSKKVSFSTLKSNIALAATSLIGVSAGVSNLGTFSGTTISDSQTVKQALQSLESATELRATTANPTFTTKISSPEFHAPGSGHLIFKALTGNDFNVHLAGEETLQVTRHTGDGNTVFTAGGGSKEFVFNQAIKQPSFSGHAYSPEWRATGTGHLKLRAETGNDLMIYLQNAEALQITRHTGNQNIYFTAGGGSKTFVFNQSTEFAGGITIGGVAVGGSSAGVIGVSGAANLGTFTGSVIADNQTIKQALQALETEVDASGNEAVGDIIALSGVAANAVNLGTFTGSVIADNQTIKAALQALETEVDASGNEAVGDLVTLTGVAANAVNLGTFTGSTISDNGTVKAGMQELETLLGTTTAAAVVSTALLSATAGTVTASKGVIVDANKDAAGFRQLKADEFHSNSSHIKFKSAGNDIMFYPANTETLQITRSGTDVRFTSNGGSGTFKFNQEVDLAGGAKLGGVAITSTAAELNVTDGVTAGTVIASKALVADANIDITGGRNITITGELEAATLDINGASQLDGTVTVGVDDTGYDVKFFGATASAYMLWDESADDLILAGAAGIEIPNAGRFVLGGNVTTSLDCALAMKNDIVFSGGARNIKFKDNTYNACRFQANNGDIFMGMDTQGDNTIFFQQPLDINTSAQIDGTLTVGVDDTGFDVKFFGDAASAYMLWDASADDLILGGAAGLIVPDGQLTLGSTAVTATAAELNVTDGVTAGTAIASKALVADANIDITGLRNLTITGDLSVAGSMTTVDTVTMTAQNAIVFEGATADAHESTLTIIDPTADRTIKLPNQSGCLPLLAADSATAITSTPEELNLLDGITAGTVSASLAVIADSNKDVTGFRNVTATGELDAATLDISGTSAFADNVIIENGKEIRLSEASGNGTHYTGFKAPAALTANVSFTLPDGDGTDGQVITTNGSAVLAWSDAPSPSEFTGVTAGTVAASKGVEVDSNKDITGFRNVTLTGELDAATGDFSGDVDIDGTANLDAVDIDGDVDIAGDLTFSAAKDVHFIDNNAAALEFAEAGNAYLTFVSTNGSEAVKISKNLDIDASDIDLSTQAVDLTLIDNTAQAFRIMEGSTEYLRVTTTNSGEKIDVSTALQLDGAVDINGAVDCSGDVTFSDAQSISVADNLGFALRVMEGSNEYVRFVTTDGSEEVDFSKSVKLDGGMTLGGGISVPASQDITLVASNSNALDFVIASGNRMMRFNTSTETVLMEQNIDVGGTANFDAVDIDGATQIDAAVTVGVDDTGYDVKFFGATSGASLLWDQSANDLILGGAAGLVVPDGKLTLGSTAVTSTAAELNVTDGVTAGTVIASKALVADANIDITGGRNITITGELDAATLDISGNADIDGTTNLDAVDIDGATQIDATVTVGVDDTGYDVKFFGATSGASLLWDESADDLILAGAAGLVVPDGQLTLASTAVTSTAAELNLLDGSTDGTWTATLNGSTGNPGSKVTATGHYVRMGKLINAFVLFFNVDTSSYTGAITVSGLPVTAKDTTNATFMGSAHNVGMISGANDSIMPLVANNGTTMTFVENSSLTALNWGTVGTGKSMRLAIQYIAA